MLGISVTSVQQLVESGELEAWKTKGGHRRIPAAAIHAYKAVPASLQYFDRARPVKPIAILVVEDNKMQREIYSKKFANWNLPATVTYCDNGYQALVEIASNKPDIVLTDIVMEGIDGYEVINTILGYPSLSDMHIAILSSLDEQTLAARGGIPEGVVFFSKPINFDELSGYLRACCAQKARQTQLHK